VVDELLTDGERMAGKELLPKNQKDFRLKSQEIKELILFGEKIVSPNFIIYYKQNNLDNSRLVVSLNKKICPKATKRNYCRRVIKSLFNEFKQSHQNDFSFLKGYDIVVILKQCFVKQDFPLIKKEFFNVLEKLRK